jgi:hypothetical protein
MKLPEIDWDKISEISARATELHQSGKMNREIWLKLANEFAAASHGCLEMPGTLGRSGESKWFNELPKVPGRAA